MGKYDDRPYEVGKGKPPRKNQFKPGMSGNPKGPPHKKKPEEASFNVLLHEAVNEQISVVIGGKERRITKKQAIVLGLVNDAVAGSPLQRIKAATLLRDAGAFEPSVEDHRMTPEMQKENAAKLIEWLIENGRRNEETKHLFAEYEQR